MGNRKNPRRDTLLYLPLFSLAQGKRLGRTADISREGLMVLSEKPLTLNKPIRVALSLPGGTLTAEEAEWKELKGTLTPRWSRPDRNPQLILSGGTFTVAEEDEPLLDHIIHWYSFSCGTRDLYRIHETKQRWGGKNEGFSK